MLKSIPHVLLLAMLLRCQAGNPVNNPDNNIPEAATRIIPVPNPTVPTLNRELQGTFNLTYQPYARQWLYQDQAGIVLTFKIALTRLSKVTGSLKIYDAINNVVISADSTNSSTGIIPPSWKANQNTNALYDFDIYWNGSGRNNKLPAGVYKSVLILHYSDSAGNTTDSSLTAIVGISLDASSAGHTHSVEIETTTLNGNLTIRDLGIRTYYY